MTEEQHAHELTIVASLLADNGRFDFIAPQVQSDDFVNKVVRNVYKAISQILNGEQEAEGITVADVATVSYLSKVDCEFLERIKVHATDDRDKLISYAKIVAGHALDRKIQSAGDAIRNLSGAQNKSAEAKIDEMSRVVADLSFAGSKPVEKLGVYGVRAAQTIIDMAERVDPNAVIGINTGFSQLNEMTCGYQGGQLIVVAGRPAMGKTAYAFATMDAAVASHHSVGMVSLEMPGEQLARRWLSMQTGIDMTRLKNGALSEEEWVRVTEETERLESLPIHITPDFNVRPDQLKNTARRMRRAGELDLLIVDYLQLMSPSLILAGETRERQISDISRTLKSIAVELDIPVIALSQLSRKVEERQDKRPLMSDLRESGSIEQDADLIIMLYRDEVYNPSTIDKGIAEILLLKQRDGPTGTVRATFDGKTTRYIDNAPPLMELPVTHRAQAGSRRKAR